MDADRSYDMQRKTSERLLALGKVVVGVSIDWSENNTARVHLLYDDGTTASSNTIPLPRWFDNNAIKAHILNVGTGVETYSGPVERPPANPVAGRTRSQCVVAQRDHNTLLK